MTARPWRPRLRPGAGEAAAARLAAALGLRPLTARVLVARGLAEPEAARAFLAADPGQRADPWLLPDAQRAVDRLRHAAARGEPVAVYGDYDADGVCAAAIAAAALERLTRGRVPVYIPHRVDEGYGLNPEALARLAAAGVRLVLTVDTGVAAVEEVAHAAALGLEVIVTDHHEPGPRWPDAVAVVHPRAPGSRYPYPWLSGAGVAYQLARALVGDEADAWLDLVALAAVADVVPLTGENRVLVRLGLERLRSDPRPGLAALCREAGVDPAGLTAWHLAFVLGPRLNAAGRVGHARTALRLLRAAGAEAEALARRLEEDNRRRQRLQEAVLAAARQQVAALGDRPVYLVSAPDWHVGVVGIVAGKLAEELGRPVLVAVEEGGRLRGSARSVPDVDITAALAAAAECLEAYGGHARAAGFTLPAERRERFVQLLEEAVAAALAALPPPAEEFDCHARLVELDPGAVAELQALEPHGEGNPPPRLCLEDLEVAAARAVGAGDAHLRLVLRTADGEGGACPAVGFGLGAELPGLEGARVDVLAVPAVGRHGGVELRVEALRRRDRPRLQLAPRPGAGPAAAAATAPRTASPAAATDAPAATEAAAAGGGEPLLRAALAQGAPPDRAALAALYRTLRGLLAGGPRPEAQLLAALARSGVPLRGPALALGLRVFAELGLLVRGPAGWQLAESPGRVALEESPTYRAWWRLAAAGGGGGSA